MKDVKPKSLVRMIIGDETRTITCKESRAYIKGKANNGKKFVCVTEISKGLDDITHHVSMDINMDYVVYIKDVK